MPEERVCLRAATGSCEHIVAGVLQGPAAALAICQHEGEEAFLFYCGADWKVRADGWHLTLEEALRQAEHEYEGVSAT